MIKKILYLTRSSALKAAGEYAEETGGYLSPVLTEMDDRTKDLELDSSFEEKVSLWSGSFSAYEVLDSRGQRLGVFGYWMTEEDGQ